MADFIENLIPHSDTFFHFANSLTAAASNTTAPIITPAQQNVLRITKIVIGSLSFGTTFLYVLYVLIRTLYTFPFRLLFQCITKKQTSHRPPSSSTSSSRRKSSKKRHRSVNGNLSSKLTSNDRTEPFLLINESHEATISHNDVGDEYDDKSIQNTLTTTRDDITTFRRAVTWKQVRNAITSDCYFFARPLARIFFWLQFCECIAVTYTLFEVAGWMSTAICHYQFFVIQFFGLAKYGWGLMIAVWMFWILALRKGNQHLLKLEVLSHVIVWVNAIIFTVIPIATRSIGNSGSYCWILGTGYHNYIRFTHYIPLWTMIAIICCIYVMTFTAVFKSQWLSFRSSNRSKQMLHFSTSAKLYIKLLGFPLVFVIVWIVPTFRRFVEMVWTWKKVSKQMPFSVLYVHAITSPANGFWYSVVFVASELVGVCCTCMRKRTEKKKTVQLQDDETELDSEYMSFEEE